MLIKKLDKTTLDVFLGQGWEQWSRFDISKGYPKLVKGSPLEQPDYKKVVTHVQSLHRPRQKQH